MKKVVLIILTGLVLVFLDINALKTADNDPIIENEQICLLVPTIPRDIPKLTTNFRFYKET